MLDDFTASYGTRSQAFGVALKMLTLLGYRFAENQKYISNPQTPVTKPKSDYINPQLSVATIRGWAIEAMNEQELF